MTRDRTRRLWAVALLSSLAGCSAVINPDTGRLGGGPAQDAGTMPPDSATADSSVVIDASGYCTNDPMCVPPSPCVTGRCVPQTRMCEYRLVDKDGDGFPARQVGSVVCTDGTDCDDSNKSAHPGATEICNGVDDDCANGVDDACEPDTCAHPSTVSLGQPDGNGVRRGSLSGQFQYLTDGTGSTCLPFDSNEKHPDAVFSLRIATSSKITLRRNSGATVVVATTSVTCAEGMNADAFWNSCDQLRNGSYSQTYNVIGSTTIFILVDALNADETGAFDIDIEVAPVR